MATYVTAHAPRNIEDEDITGIRVFNQVESWICERTASWWIVAVCKISVLHHNRPDTFICAQQVLPIGCKEVMWMNAVVITEMHRLVIIVFFFYKM